MESIEEMAAHVGLQPKELALVRKVPIFQSADDRQFLRLMRVMLVRQHPRNYTLFCQGEPANRCYVVLRGWVRLYRSLPDGGEVTVSIFTNGESFAEAALFESGSFPVTAATADDSRLLVVNAQGLLNILEDDPKLCFSIMASMARKLHFFVRQIEQLSQRTTKQRLAAFLLTLVRGQPGSVSIRLPLDKHLIAARLGMQPETFSRALAKLKSDGVHVEGEVVRIDDTRMLQRVVGKED